MTTLIIGKNSNLSKTLSKKIPNCVLVSSRELSINIDLLLEFKNKKINIIFNNFQTALQLNETDHLNQYIENAIGITSKTLEYFRETDIQKIIYTSSSSVYGNNIFCNESDDVNPLSLHAALKVSNEKMIEKYCINRNINYTITRVFNMYGEKDTFSIISKIIASHTNNTILPIVNNGNAIRDFIHINDVVKVYAQLLTLKNIPIVNVGTGSGNSIKSILTFLKNHNINLNVENIYKEELKVSTANNTLLFNKLEISTFIDVESYLLGILAQGNV